MNELFFYDGTFVELIYIDRELDLMEIRYWGDRQTTVVDYEELQSATPYQLEQIA